ncbi:ab-hydrolase associated lipase region [Ancylostoma ceylanicum]|uniref:Ab-hydrolase associated lipase region n=1 Tax=Ancylostoma ceylanicum TaxID=53326 RepID=A0A0D6L6B5_9BILA|nr:ab-hydrolase associated lipase region [Ancylostoma ceylanicum]
MLLCSFLVALAAITTYARKHEDPECKMTTPQIIEHWGYPAEIYTVTTEDGYILELHRIPYGKNGITLIGSPSAARRCKAHIAKTSGIHAAWARMQQ